MLRLRNVKGPFVNLVILRVVSWMDSTHLAYMLKSGFLDILGWQLTGSRRTQAGSERCIGAAEF